LSLLIVGIGHFIFATDTRRPFTESDVKWGTAMASRVWPNMAPAFLAIHPNGLTHTLGVPQLSQPRSGRTPAKMA
jgi:hypothetical protein